MADFSVGMHRASSIMQFGKSVAGNWPEDNFITFQNLLSL